MRRVVGVAPAAAWRSAPASLVLDGAQGCVVVVLLGLGWLLVALVVALGLDDKQRQSCDDGEHQQPHPGMPLLLALGLDRLYLDLGLRGHASALDAEGIGGVVVARLLPVSYTHLTLPTT